MFKRLLIKLVSIELFVFILFFYTSLGLTDITLTGKVNRTDGLSLPGVNVELFTNNVKFSSTTTDNNGNFSLTVATETFWVFVSSPGFYANLSTGVVVNPGQTRSLDIFLSTAPAGLVSYWKFDEGNGIIAFDYSGFGNHGRIISDPKWVGGMYGGALSLDGNDDYVLVPESDSIPYGADARTVEVRIYTYPDTWAPDANTVFEYGGIGRSYGIDMDDYPYVQYYIWKPVVPKDDLNKIDTGTSYEGWLFLTVTWDGATTLSGYVNDRFKGSVTTDGLDTVRTDINIGRGSIKGPWYYHGLIDEVRIYNRELQLAEIRADMGTVTGAISGKVTKADGITPVPDTLIQFVSGTLIVSSVTTNSLGQYSTSMNAGSYIIQTIAKGYQLFVTSSSIYIPPGKIATYNIVIFELTEGLISTIAGVGNAGYSGDDRLATSAELNSPRGVCADTFGNIYIAEFDGQRIRKIDSNGIINTIAGNGIASYNGDDTPAKTARLNYPNGVDIDYSGNLYISDFFNQRIRKISTSGKIYTVAGNGTSGYSGDNALAVNSQIYSPQGVCIDITDNIYIADMNNNRIRKINSVSGVISTVAGMGTAGFAGDGGLATDAKLNAPSGVYVDTVGNIYIADSSNHRVRKVDSTTGNITTVAGTGIPPGFTGDGGPATSAKLSSPKNLYVDPLGNVYISDYGNNCVRKIDTSGTITTVAGTGGSAGYRGDGGLAVNAQLDGPGQIYMDSIGNLYIADMRNHRVRKVFLGLPIGTLNGKVTKSDGITVLSGVLVQVMSGTSVIKSTFTDGTGNYTLSLATGVYTVQVSYSGYQTQAKSDVLIKRIDTTGLNFSLEVITNLPKPKSAGEIKIYGGTSSRGAINPTKGEKAVIGFKGSNAGTFYLRIFNITGDLIYQENKPFPSAEGVFEWIPSGNLAPDIYIVSVEGSGIKIKNKIAIVK